MNKGHGRIEKRQCWTISDLTCLRMLPGLDRWKNLDTLVKVQAERQVNDKTTSSKSWLDKMRTMKIALDFRCAICYNHKKRRCLLYRDNRPEM